METMKTITESFTFHADAVERIDLRPPAYEIRAKLGFPA